MTESNTKKRKSAVGNVAAEQHAAPTVKAEPAEDISLEEEGAGSDPELEEDFKKLKGMKNSKIKKKKNMEFLLSTIRDRLKPIGLDLFNITLEKEKVDLIVPRAFLTATYGGSPMQVFPKIGPKFVEQHGMDDFMYLNPVFQPEAPQVPGAPGLYLDPPGEEDTQSPWPTLKRVFTKIDDKPSRSQYMGQYQVCSCKPLTKEEWASQTTRVRGTWAIHLVRDKWGLGVCARIRARRVFGREPTKAEVDDMYELLGRNDSKHLKPSPEDVQAAFLKGEERMRVYTMKCVGYDSAFQIGTYEKFQNWVPPDENSGKQKKASTRNKTVSSAGQGSSRGRKRKRIEAEIEDDEDEDEGGYYEVGSHREMSRDQGGLVYRPRGTRSRPIYL